MALNKENKKHMCAGVTFPKKNSLIKQSSEENGEVVCRGPRSINTQNEKHHL